MNKKALKVIGLVIFAAVLVSVFIIPMPVISKAPDAVSTCCPQQESICVTPTGNIDDYYGKPEGGSC